MGKYIKQHEEYEHTLRQKGFCIVKHEDPQKSAVFPAALEEAWYIANEKEIEVIWCKGELIGNDELEEEF